MTDTTPAVAASQSADILFSVDHVTLRFGGVTSLRDVSLNLNRGEMLSVIGPNGAGKTSLFNCLTGVYRPQEGSIRFTPKNGHSVSVIGRKPYKVNRLGVARTFQTSRMFSALTAFENVKIGVESKQHTGPIGAMLRLPRTRREEHESDLRTLELLKFVGLTRHANDLSSSLAYGDRRRLEIARALGTNPEVLLLDEPAAGTNPAEKLELADADPQGQHRARHHRAADRARHEARDVGGRADHRAELRRGDRGGIAGRDPEGPDRDQRLPRLRRQRRRRRGGDS